MSAAEIARGRTCESCRWWDIRNIGSRVGTCRHQTGDTPHRAWVGGGYCMDSFGFEETRARDTCSFHDTGRAVRTILEGQDHE